MLLLLPVLSEQLLMLEMQVQSWCLQAEVQVPVGIWVLSFRGRGPS